MKILVIETVACVSTAVVPTQLSQYNEWLNKRLSYIPDEYLDSATIRTEQNYEYGSAKLIIEYSRPETEQEREIRESEIPLKVRLQKELESKFGNLGKVINLKVDYKGVVATIRVANSIIETPLRIESENEDS